MIVSVSDKLPISGRRAVIHEQTRCNSSTNLWKPRPTAATDTPGPIAPSRARPQVGIHYTGRGTDRLHADRDWQNNNDATTTTVARAFRSVGQSFGHPHESRVTFHRAPSSNTELIRLAAFPNSDNFPFQFYDFENIQH
jgi:hypothetical protein